jgi:hypothetical protein
MNRHKNARTTPSPALTAAISLRTTGAGSEDRAGALCAGSPDLLIRLTELM